MNPASRILTEEEMEILKERALDCFQDDVHADARYARETVEYLAEEAGKDQDWWLEFLSTDPDVHADLLGFDPYSND